ncbi:MAG: type II secretion system F family protein, partial [Candidatus Contendobacter sp.]
MKYQYNAVNARGKPIEGTLQADHERTAIRQLQRQGLTVIDLRPARAPVRTGARHPPRAPELLMVLHQLTTLLESGVTLNEAVISLAETQPHPFVARAFSDMATQLQRGASFAAALRQSGLPLPDYFRQLAEAGELTGRLAEALRGGLNQYQYELAVAAEFRNALIYPSILIVSGIAAVTLIFVLVVPKFASLLTKTKAAVPWLSQWVLGLG